jgi:GNAT superfamily N-acetyltransferase
MTTIIKDARPDDILAIVQLAEEMDHFYGETNIESPERRASQITEAIFSDPASAYAILAWDDSNLSGFASYSFLWPAVGLTRSLYLKELYIAENARRQGVAKLLMQRLCQIAVQHDCSRVEWTTDQSNADAQQFYAQLGVPVNRSKLFYRLEGDDLIKQAHHTSGK